MKVLKEKIYIVFSGYNQRGILAFCRRLSALNKKFYVIASNMNDFIFKTKYKNKVAFIRYSKVLDIENFKEIINKIIINKETEKLIICPSSEFLNQFLLKNRKYIESLDIEIPLTDISTYEMITNKNSFSKLCKEKNIVIPPRFSCFEKANIPFVAKPKINIKNNRTLYPYLITNEAIKKEFFQKEDTQNFYYEEFIDSPNSYYLLYYFSPFNYSIAFSQENLLQQADGKSIVFAKSSDIHKKDISNTYKNLLVEIGFTGLIMIELRKRDDKYYMIEANPRLWGPSQLLVDNKIKILDAFIYESVFNERFNGDVFDNKKTRKYLWLGGILENLSEKKKLRSYLKSKWKQTLYFIPAIFNDVYLRSDSIAYFFYELKLILQPRRL